MSGRSSKLHLPLLPTSGGVYSIRCLANGKVYIGSTRNLYSRARVHRSLLFNGLHYNDSLQDDYRQHGADAFEFAVLTLAECVHQRLDFEYHHMRKLAAKNRYNTVHKSGKHIPGMSYKFRATQQPKQEG